MSWVAHTEEDINRMLSVLGISSVEELFDVIPEYLREPTIQLPPPLSEMEIRAYCERLAFRNASHLICFLGGGFYDHYVPAVVDALATRGEFLTAYTPYQAECAQGTLQSIYEYQTVICRLTEMEFSNASLYDGGTAVFEAVAMALRITGRNVVRCSSSLNPLYRKMLETHMRNLDVTIETGEEPCDAACVVVQNPAFRGYVRDYTRLAEQCHEKGSLLILVFYPISLGILKTPGEMGVDIAVGEGQSLGIPLSFGGPYLGILATRKEYIRKMPGRLAAATLDIHGNRGFVLTLQAREQHIRREKAMSNICSNEAHCALRALIYLCLLGKKGLEELAIQCYSKAEYLKKLLPREWVIDEGPTFNEFVLRLPRRADWVVGRMLEYDILAGLPLAEVGAGESEELLVAVTEKRTKYDLERYAKILREVLCS